ncbi:MAG: hypothetical protein ABIG10_03955 [bacterium]
MAEEKAFDYGEELIGWEIPEYEKHERGPLWYALAGLISVAIVIYGIYSHNYLFVIIIGLFVLISVINHFREPDMIEFAIMTEGIIIGNKFHDHDTIKHFSIIYKPGDNLKSLYLEFKNIIKPRLTVPLMNANPLVAREHLLKYIMEDLDRTDEPNTDFITKKLKL